MLAIIGLLLPMHFAVPAPVFAAEAGEPVARWVMLEDSTLTFAYRGSPISGHGRFEDFTGDIRFDPDRPEATRLSFLIETASVRLGAPQAQTMIADPRWFDIDRFPVARFEATGATSLGVDDAGAARFGSDGTLHWKGISAPVTIAFSVTVEDDRARATVTATVDRRVFGIGTGDAEEDEAIAGDVTVTAIIHARRPAPVP